MFFILLLAFILTPLLEIYVFIEAGSAFGAAPVILAILATALLGAMLVRAQGLGVLHQARADLDTGKPPVEAAAHGVFLLIAGALLLTPGFVTDALGFALLIPPLRLAMARRILAGLRSRVVVIDHRDGR